MPDLRVDPTRAVVPLERVWLARALQGILGLCILHAVLILVLGLDVPLLGPHSFRQTQTALSAYWLAKGGPFLAYETPVLGSPWSIPFEFPFFQGLVAGIGQMGVPLDAAGRATSFAFFLGSLLPLRLLFRHLRFDGPTFTITAILLISCPILLFWGRAFLIESCAVFFALLWLALLACYLDKPWPIVAFATLSAGCLAVLVKATTFVPFFALGGSLVVARWLQAGHPRKTWSTTYTVAIALGLLPIIVGLAWVAFTDSVKSHNEIARSLTSDALVGWNFGTLDQKFGRILWLDTVWTRVLPETLGLAFLIGLAALIGSLVSRRHYVASLMSLAAFTLPFVLFTNLHIVHDYYQSANAGFLIAAVGISIGAMYAGRYRLLAVATLLVIVAGQFATFYIQFHPYIRGHGDDDRFYRIAALARQRTDPTQSLIVIGNDWSSIVPYYSERKSLVVPSWASSSVIARMIDDPQSLLGSDPLGAIVSCESGLTGYTNGASNIAAFVRDRKVLATVDGCELLSGQR